MSCENENCSGLFTNDSEYHCYFEECNENCTGYDSDHYHHCYYCYKQYENCICDETENNFNPTKFSI